MSRVMAAWEQVLREAVSSDYDEQQFALLQIGLVLQRHNPHLMMDSDAEEEALSRELLRLTLNEQRQEDTVQYLITLVRNHPKNADIFLYSLTNAQSKILTEPLLQLLQDVGEKLNADAIFQSLTAVDNILKHSDENVIELLDKIDIIPLLDDWADGDDTIIANKADILADKIVDLLETE